MKKDQQKSLFPSKIVTTDKIPSKNSPSKNTRSSQYHPLMLRRKSGDLNKNSFVGVEQNIGGMTILPTLSAVTKNELDSEVDLLNNNPSSTPVQKNGKLSKNSYTAVKFSSTKSTQQNPSNHSVSSTFETRWSWKFK